MNVLIVGKNSYISQSIGSWFSCKNNAPKIEYISVRNDNWKNMDMSVYDVVIFSAAIVHNKNVQDWELYKKINATLPYEFAKKAKSSGVRHFLFLSSAAVFSSEKNLPTGNIIDSYTQLTPASMYGKSKLLAEQLLESLQNETFNVSVIRPMNVYGKNCKGNYIPLFTKITRLLPILPKAFDNVRQGMIYIDNLSELCWLVIHSSKSGVYMAQDDNPVSAYDIMYAIASSLGLQKASIRCTLFFRLFHCFPPVCKFFGGVAYDNDFAKCELGNYQIVDFQEGIQRTLL